MHRYHPEDLAAIYRVIAERRDMRHFLPDPVDPAVLARLLEAAHRVPSVGLMKRSWSAVSSSWRRLPRGVKVMSSVGARCRRWILPRLRAPSRTSGSRPG
jgi:nitroreductase family protein